MKLSDKKFGKIFAKPDRTEPAKISRTPNRTEISVASYMLRTFICVVTYYLIKKYKRNIRKRHMWQLNDFKLGINIIPHGY